MVNYPIHNPLRDSLDNRIVEDSLLSDEEIMDIKKKTDEVARYMKRLGHPSRPSRKRLEREINYRPK